MPERKNAHAIPKGNRDPGGSSTSTTPLKRHAKRLARKPGDLYAAKLRVWRALLRAEDILDSSDESTVLRAVHAISQAAMCYAKLHETANLEVEIQEIKKILESRNML